LWAQEVEEVIEEKAIVITEQDTVIHEVVDEQAVFNEGNIQKYIGENYTLTSHMLKKGLPGSIFVTFIVEKDGTLSNICVLPGKGLSPEQDEEALRIIRSTSGKWEPAKIQGIVVRSLLKQRFVFSPDIFY